MLASHTSQPEPDTGVSLIEMLLHEQQVLTAVDRFAQVHAEATTPLQETYYQDLIEIDGLQPGEQLAFEVDLDACSGCKACVVACHHLNGLENEETWRSVGLLADVQTDHELAAFSPDNQASNRTTLQHVTTTCHHCVDPGCLRGCPVKAYEKDETTGIVRHLDDQCIGCQYCTWMCPYDVPTYSPAKGIVRKCDMCHQRLAVGEAPACVQSCPNGAIRIRKVKQSDISDDARQSTLLPGAPPSRLTTPTTRFVSQRDVSQSRPADAAFDRPEHAHWPLILMLVLTQMSVGVVTLEIILGNWLVNGVRLGLLSAAAISAMAGVGAATLHLGRPLYGFRSFLGLGTSWLSREAIAFGLYVPTLCGVVVFSYLAPTSSWGTLASGVAWFWGAIGVLSSVMIYAVTSRPFWAMQHTAFRFLCTTVGLGAAVVLIAQVDSTFVGIAALGMSIAQIGYVVQCHGIFAWLGCNGNDRSVALLRGPLRMVAVAQLACLCLSVVALLVTIVGGGISFAVLFFALRLASDVLERYLFFTAVVSFRMPGIQTA